MCKKVFIILKSKQHLAFCHLDHVDLYLRKHTGGQKDLGVHENTLNWTAKCSVTKTFSRHSNKLETVSNNTHSVSQLEWETKAIYYWPTYSNVLKLPTDTRCRQCIHIRISNTYTETVISNSTDHNSPVLTRHSEAGMNANCRGEKRKTVKKGFTQRDGHRGRKEKCSCTNVTEYTTLCLMDTPDSKGHGEAGWGSIKIFFQIPPLETPGSSSEAKFTHLKELQGPPPRRT